MNWEAAHVEDYSLFPWPVNLALTLSFIAAAVVIARQFRPWMLVVYWAVVTGIGVAIALSARWPLDWSPAFQVAEVLLRVAIPTGMGCLAVGWLRRRRPRAGVVLVGAALLAFLGGLVVAGLLTPVLYDTFYEYPPALHAARWGQSMDDR